MSAPDPLVPLFLLHDEPIVGDGDNYFSPDVFATTVARAALGTKGPFTIGVYGDWGSGKTSVLRAAKRMIDVAPEWTHVVTVEFNAWRYEREEHPIVPLVATIERAVTEKLRNEKEIVKRAGEVALRGFKLFKRGTRALLSAVSGEVGGKATFPLVGEVDASLSIDPSKGLESWDNTETARESQEEAAWTKASQSALYKSIFDRLDVLGDQTARDGEVDLSTFPRVVVFIDDLDRCQADTAFELLESVKLVLSQPGFVFVLALNERVVRMYLDHLAASRYGEKNIAIHKSYLDKIVQLPLHMPARSGGLEGFAKDLLDRRLGRAAGMETAADLKKLAKVLALSANRTPRSLVRRINTALVDIALRDPATLPRSLGSESAPYPAFSGLCIVQRTLEAAIGADLTRELAQEQALCDLLLSRQVFGALDVVATIRARSAPASDRPEVDDFGDVEPRRAERWDAILQQIYNATFLWFEDRDEDGELVPGSSVLSSTEGTRWLSKREERWAVMQIAYQRPEAVSPAAPTQGSGGEKPVAQGSGPSEQEQQSGATPLPLSKVQAIIERKIRQSLRLPAEAPLGVAEFARVRELDLSGEPVTDDGVAWLVDPKTGLKGVTPLWSKGITAAEPGSDQFVHAGAGLRSLNKLNLTETQVGDAAAIAIASKHSALKSLITLLLTRTDVGDLGAAALAARDSSLKSLTTLGLGGTDVGDTGVAALASKETGLVSLTNLYLSNTAVGDMAAAALAHADSGLSALSSIELNNTHVGDIGVAAMASRVTSLGRLTSLALRGTEVGDTGASALATKETGLKSLEELDLTRARVSDRAAEAIRKAHPRWKVTATHSRHHN